MKKYGFDEVSLATAADTPSYRPSNCEAPAGPEALRMRFRETMILPCGPAQITVRREFRDFSIQYALQQLQGPRGTKDRLRCTIEVGF